MDDWNTMNLRAMRLVMKDPTKKPAYYKWLRTSGHYDYYLKSPRWIELRKNAKKRDHYRCIKCGSTEYLEVHHTRYDHLGEAREIDDLETVCHNCHTHIIHENQFIKSLSPESREIYIKVKQRLSR